MICWGGIKGLDEYSRNKPGSGRYWRPGGSFVFLSDMHNAAIAALDVDYCYVAFHVLPDRVGEGLKGLHRVEYSRVKCDDSAQTIGDGTHGSHFRRSAGCGCGSIPFRAREMRWSDTIRMSMAS